MYIGETYLHLFAHIEDHKGIFLKTSQSYPIPSNNNNCDQNLEAGNDTNKKTLSFCHAAYEVLSKTADSILIR